MLYHYEHSESEKAQSRGKIEPASPMSLTVRRSGKAALLLVLLSVIGVALTVPFVFETQTLWYKFGVDKTMLRSGKMVGLVTVILLFSQLLLAARIKLLDRLLGLDHLFLFHRFNGGLLLTFGIVHAVLVLLPEGLTNLPIGRKYWPEMVGGSVLLLISLQVCMTLLRSRLKIPYGRWRLVHRPLGYLIFAGITVHVLNVSESFSKMAPGYVFIIIVVLIILTISGTKLADFLQNRKTARIDMVSSQTDLITCLDISLPEARSFSFLPGQFAYLAFESDRFAEPHPFTVASSPTAHDRLQFMIKNCGDWTAGIAQLNVNERVKISGPYGRFSHLLLADDNELILIAGGIGVTPILSMLRYMADREKRRQVTFIWCNSRPADMFLRDELTTIEERMPNLRMHLVYTRARHGARRIDMDMINSLTRKCDRKSCIFVCGPHLMMRRVIEDCRALGFSGRNIFHEHFSL